MSVFLFTDFGAADLYVGQVKAVLAQRAPGVTVIDLLHEAPAFNVKASAHLLAALALQLPRGSVTLAVVDPGVGSARDAMALSADGSWYVGPDNGLFSVLAARAAERAAWRIARQPDKMSASFHGRDLFAPVAAEIARGDAPTSDMEPISGFEADFGGDDLGAIIYLDHYGNAMTGLRAQALPPDARVTVAGCSFVRARVFSDVPEGDLFWYENSVGLVEIAGNRCSAAVSLGLRIDQPVAVCA